MELVYGKYIVLQLWELHKSTAPVYTTMLAGVKLYTTLSRGQKICETSCA